MVDVLANSHISSSTTQDGIRPVNLRSDLGNLADLIELVFADTMDSGGRAALREMRALSRLGPGLRVVSRLNDLAMGMSLGYVWSEAGQLVGNVSVYPSTWPQAFGPTYVIANVGVHPDYRGHGIAKRLMDASMQMIADKGGKRAILQVDHDNAPALHVYRSLGFIEERTFINWRRTSSVRVPPRLDETPDVMVRRRRRSEWQQEHDIAAMVRPNAAGGLGWQNPIHVTKFKRGLWRSLLDFFNLRGVERLVLPRPDDRESIAAYAWVETAFGLRTKVTLLSQPQFTGAYSDMLLANIVRRYGRNVLTVEHPADDTATSTALERYKFYEKRRVVHMRWDV